MFMLVDKEATCLCPVRFSRKNKRRFLDALLNRAGPESKRSKFHARFPRTGITDSSKIPRATKPREAPNPLPPPRHKNL